MKEQLGQHPTERYWKEAVNNGLLRDLRQSRGRDENSSLGRTFEYLGFAYVQEQYADPKYLLTNPDETWRLRKILTPEDYDLWQPRIPDGILFERTASSKGLRLLNLVEYKVANYRNVTQLRHQFDGYLNLIDLLTHDKGSRGRGILKQVLHAPVPLLEKSPDIRCLYVTPSDRTAADVTTTLGGEDYFQEIHFPQTSQEIKRRMQELQRKRI